MLTINLIARDKNKNKARNNVYVYMTEAQVRCPFRVNNS